MDQRPADGEADRGAEPVVPSDQGEDARPYRKIMELHANSSNNTVYADADGHIAYFHPQFVPRRDDRFDWTRPVDGSDPATEWHGVHSIEDSPHVIDPPNGWIQNTNDWPYSAAGPYSPKRKDFPEYMDTAGESPRGLHAIRVLEGRERLHPRTAARCGVRQLSHRVRPARAAAAGRYDSTGRMATRSRRRLAEPIAALRAGTTAGRRARSRRRSRCTGATTLTALVRGEAGAAGHVGLRLHGDARDDDSSGSTPSPRPRTGSRATSAPGRRRGARSTASSVSPGTSCSRSTIRGRASRCRSPRRSWGSLASFGARTYPGTKRMYGTSGNSFVAVVEFGKDSVRAHGGDGGRRERGSPRRRTSTIRRSGMRAGSSGDVYFYPGQDPNSHMEGKYKQREL